jgi:hypothetical protein
VIHAAVEGRFDCGALVLLDLDMLLRAETLDWPLVLAEAEQEGWLRHAALLLALVERWLRPGLVEQTGCTAACSRRSHRHRRAADGAGSPNLPRGRVPRQCRRCRGERPAAALGMRKLLRGSADAAEEPASAGEGGYGAWLSDRLRRSVAAPFNRSTRRQAAGTGQCSAGAKRTRVADLAGLRITLLTASASRLGGGVASALYGHAAMLREAGAAVTVVALDDAHSDRTVICSVGAAHHRACRRAADLRLCSVAARCTARQARPISSTCTASGCIPRARACSGRAAPASRT